MYRAKAVEKGEENGVTQFCKEKS